MKNSICILLVLIFCFTTSCHKFVEPNVQIGATTLCMGDTTLLEWSNVKSFHVNLFHPEDSICIFMDSTSNSMKIYANKPGNDTLFIGYEFLYRDYSGAPGHQGLDFITVLPKE